MSKRPNKSFLLTGLLALVAMVAPFVNDVAEQCCGITVTEAELQHLLYAFLGSAGVGAGVGIHKRHVAGKAAGNGGAAGPGNGSGGSLISDIQAALNARSPKGGHAGSDDLADDIVRTIHELEDEDDDPDDDTPPPKGGD